MFGLDRGHMCRGAHACEFLSFEDHAHAIVHGPRVYRYRLGVLDIIILDDDHLHAYACMLASILSQAYQIQPPRFL